MTEITLSPPKVYGGGSDSIPGEIEELGDYKKPAKRIRIAG